MVLPCLVSLKNPEETQKYMNVKCVVTMCMYASVTVDSLCLLGLLVVLQVLISLLAPVKYIIKLIKFNKVETLGHHFI